MLNPFIKRFTRWLVSIFLCGLLAVSVWADQQVDYQRTVDEIAMQITKLSRTLNANKALLKSEQDKLSNTEQKILLINRRRAATSKQIRLQQQAGKDLDRQIAELSASQEKDKKALLALIRERYQRGAPNYLKMILNLENPYAVGRLNNYYDYFSQAQQLKLSKVRTQIAQNKHLQQVKLQAINTLEQQQSLQIKQQQELDLATQNRRRTVARLNQRVALSNNKLKQLIQDRARLNKLLEQIAEQAKRLQILEKQQAEQEKRRQGEALPNSKAGVTSAKLKGGFLKQRGRLQYPVSGKQKARFGSRLVESGMRSQGVFFETNGMLPVKSIFRGRVLFADYLKGYGLLLIVDHGDDHISLYGHNELLYKKVGDRVETNEIVAKSGVSGGRESPGLYFEIRHNAIPTNPAKWCQ